MTLLELIQFDLHFRHVFKIAVAEQRVADWRSLDVTLKRCFVGKVYAPCKELGSSTSALMQRVRVDDIEY